MNETCGNCKYYDNKKTINNCKANIVGKVNSEQMGCYKIQFSKIK